MIPGFVFKKLARDAIKPVMQMLVIAALIAALPGLVSSTVVILTGADPSEYLTPVVNQLRDLMLEEEVTYGDLSAIEADMYTALNTFWKEKGLLYVGMLLMELALTPVLSLGLYNALLKALRRQEVAVLDGLSRLGCFVKIILLQLLTVLKVTLWMLPGMAVTLAGTFISPTVAMIAMLAGSIMMMVMGVQAVYRYALAPYVMADQPQTGVFACIRRSCEVMKHRKMELFSLEISFILWQLAVSWLQSLAMGMFGTVVGLTVGMFAMLFVNVYMQGSILAFYEGYAVRGGKVKVEFPEPEDDLNE